jgi:hypothetical protein
VRLGVDKTIWAYKRGYKVKVNSYAEVGWGQNNLALVIGVFINMIIHLPISRYLPDDINKVLPIDGNKILINPARFFSWYNS